MFLRDSKILLTQPLFDKTETCFDREIIPLINYIVVMIV